MKKRNRLVLAVCLLFAFASIVTISVAQQGLPDGKKLYNYSNDHLVVPTHGVSFVPQPSNTPGLINGAIAIDGANAYILIAGVWRKFTIASPTPSATFTPTPTP